MSEHFSNVGRTLAEAFDDSDDNDVSLDYFGDPSHNLFKFEPVTEEFVRDLLLSLKDSSPGYDELPIQIYKECRHILGPSNTKIYNVSLLLGEFSKELAIVKVKCLHKSGSKSLLKPIDPFQFCPSPLKS